MARIVVLISGSGSNLQALIDAQKQGQLGEDAHIVSVISSSKKAYGLTRAADNNILTKVCSLYPYTKGIAKEDKAARAKARSQFENDLAKLVLEEKPDVIICAGWLLILGSTFLSQLQSVPILNLHPALPGCFDGTTHAIEMAWRKCQDENKPLTAGCMVHYVIEEVDKGEPLVVKKLEIIPGEETLEQYEQRVHDAEHIAIVEATYKVLQQLHK
ncbi:ADE_G0012370.mRNA.1.CDS.1 [Saccharomyces cerevisiae]|nr:phosphoribosylglycinamide formyltransferase [Saccharomyces cerevisiae]CAI4364909.1 CAS_1a_G0012460.mRNA.1.CDS.1 [Saccharomyces cerevisiae]CAI4373312.1 ADE_G0012370.mRNA.1.CDS.1 [Saccharomyces cerevisiae]CAI6579841.1 ADE_G0012370.mRNA.1.CDS.1 [Saccharomyces cerevisiae]CAI7222457.1 CAS_1a_G0012460.mRNA.1.CDS.1 [Saccharomyces cerevisiae]